MLAIIFLLFNFEVGAGTPKAIATPTAISPMVHNTCYLHHFEITRFPWPLGDCLNYEEVFKNFQFYEAKWDQANLALTLKKFENGTVIKTQSFKYLNKKLIEKKIIASPTPIPTPKT